jgi:CheY-like chemotaxis protein
MRIAGRHHTGMLLGRCMVLRDMLRETLAGHGYGVLLARDGVEALRAADERAGLIQVLASDLVMPGRSGLDEP